MDTSIITSEGVISEYFDDAKVGYIKSGFKRYFFTHENVKSNEQPQVGDQVEFSLNKSKEITNVWFRMELEKDMVGTQRKSESNPVDTVSVCTTDKFNTITFKHRYMASPYSFANRHEIKDVPERNMVETERKHELNPDYTINSGRNEFYLEDAVDACSYRSKSNLFNGRREVAEKKFENTLLDENVYTQARKIKAYEEGYGIFNSDAHIPLRSTVISKAPTIKSTHGITVSTQNKNKEIESMRRMDAENIGEPGISQTTNNVVIPFGTRLKERASPSHIHLSSTRKEIRELDKVDQSFTIKNPNSTHQRSRNYLKKQSVPSFSDANEMRQSSYEREPTTLYDKEEPAFTSRDIGTFVPQIVEEKYHKNSRKVVLDKEQNGFGVEETKTHESKDLYQSIDVKDEITYQGIVIRLPDNKRFGFIKPTQQIAILTENNKDDLFFHFNQLKSIEPVIVNDAVQFTIKQDNKDNKISASNVIVLNSNGSIDQRKLKLNVTSAVSSGSDSASSSEHSEKHISKPLKREEIKTNPNKSNIFGVKDAGINKSTEDIRSEKTRNLAVSGIIKNVITEKKFGFIQPIESSGLGEEDIFFHFDRIQMNHLLPRKGDRVEFYTYSTKKNQLAASRVILVELKYRTNAEITDYLSTITKHMYDEEMNGRQRQQYISELLYSSATWKGIANIIHSFPNDDQLLIWFLLSLSYIKDVKNGLDQSFGKVLKSISESKLFHPRKGCFKRFISSCEDTNQQEWCEKFLKMMATYVPEKIPVIIQVIKPFVSKLEPEFLYELLQLSVKGRLDNIEDMVWKDIPLILTSNEMMCSVFNDEINLQKVQIKGKYRSSEDYMDTYFRLLRHDCFAKLKEGITKLRNGKLDLRDMNVYKNITLVGVELSKDCIYLALKIVSCKKVKNWETSSDLMYGNLLCLAFSGSFKHPIWLTVASRELLKKESIVMVQTCNEHNEMNDGDILLNLITTQDGVIMVESPSYYRAFQPVLQSLQMVIPSEVSFVSELVDITPGPVPDFLLPARNTFNAEIVYTDITERITLQTFFDRPHDTAYSIFDESQERAVKTALQSRLGIIQGPPGCGKSFIGVQVLRLLLSLSGLKDPKVLLLTYKNHALDEFLKDAMKYLPVNEIVRIGGRSRDEELDKISLRNVNRRAESQLNLRGRKNELDNNIRGIKADVENQLDTLKNLIHIPYQFILACLSEEQKFNLINGCNWNQTNQKSIVQVQDEEGFTKQKKHGNKITKEEVDYILRKSVNDNNTDLLTTLCSTAFLQWLPKEEQMTDFEKSLTNERISTTSTAPEIIENSNVLDDIDEKDVDEVETERLSAVSKGKSDSRKIKKLEIPKLTPDGTLKAFSNLAISKLQDIECYMLTTEEDPWKLTIPERISLVQYLAKEERKESTIQFQQKMEEFEKLCNERTEIENQEISAGLENIKVVGMTITGASIHQSLLKEIRPQIVIVEEAAEVLEPQLVACIGSWTEYMILIGDHKQLRPPVETYKLRKEFNFDVSLMERMISNDMAFETLDMQNRQREEFADLLKDIYPNLKTNLKRVQYNEPTKCLAKSFYFWHHTEEEQKERSVTNIEEANRAVKLALFMVQQGHDPEKITILATYQGQTALIRTTLKKMEESYKDLLGNENITKSNKNANGVNDESAKKCIKVYTVDMYQGDENDFVIVSLVRSNKGNKIGFLGQLNRRCVAQSRAKCGVYFIGNADMFLNDPTWQPMMTKFKNNGRIGDCIEVKCQHHDKEYKMKNAKAFTLAEFCKEPCLIPLSCGKHRCARTCQPPHTHNPCPVQVQFFHRLCNHKGKRLCEDDEEKKRCNTEVNFTFLRCNHGGKKPCYEDQSSLICSFKEKVKLNCGHLKEKLCFENKDSLKCVEKCVQKMPRCNHPCDHLCYAHNNVKLCKICEKIQDEKIVAQRKQEEEIIRKERENAEREIKNQRKILAVQKGAVVREEIFPMGETASVYLDVEDQVMKYIKSQHDWYPKVTKIEKVINPTLKIKWLEAKKKLFDPEMKSKLKFHGTSVDGVKGITENGFRLPTPVAANPNPPMFGYGVYFASDSSKSAREIYTKGSNMLLLCDVLLGKSWTLDSVLQNADDKYLKDRKCDSLFAKRGSKRTHGVDNDEYIVFNPDQAYPMYIIHYNTTKFNVTDIPTAMPTFRSDFRTSKKILKPKREVRDDPLDNHFRIAESQFYRLMGNLGGVGNNVKIKEIDFFMDAKLKQNFDQKQLKFKSKYGNQDVQSDYIFGFHGTKDPLIVENIMNNNFKQSVSGKFGAGVYFSEVPEYTFGYGGNKHLILAKVLTGKIYQCQNARMGSCGVTNGYDSHGGYKQPNGTYHEIVIFDVNQILPCYVIHLQ